jgi:hypothetical protein
MPYFVRLGPGDAIIAAGSTDAEAIAHMQEAEGDAVVEVIPAVIGTNASALLGQIFDRATGIAAPAPSPSE